jgi:hypothetical protein
MKRPQKKDMLVQSAKGIAQDTEKDSLILRQND